MKFKSIRTGKKREPRKTPFIVINGVKATTEEGMGFTGAGEGISSQAIALLETVENHVYDPMMMDDDVSKCQRCQGCHKEEAVEE